jgi:hypothetical protein
MSLIANKGGPGMRVLWGQRRQHGKPGFISRVTDNHPKKLVVAHHHVASLPRSQIKPLGYYQMRLPIDCAMIWNRFPLHFL